MSTIMSTTGKRLPIPAGVELSGALKRCPNCHLDGAEVGHHGIRKVILCRHCNHGFGVAMRNVNLTPVAPAPTLAVVHPAPRACDGESVYQQARRMLDEFKRDFPAWSDADIQRHAEKGVGWLLSFRKSVHHDDPRSVRKSQNIIRLLADLREEEDAGIRAEHRAAIALAAAAKHLNILSAAFDAAQAELADLRSIVYGSSA